jgi:hypothetical protein
MAKYKIEEEKVYGMTIGFYVKVKRNWWSLWRYLRATDGTITKYETKKGAQAAINLRSIK